MGKRRVRELGFYSGIFDFFSSFVLLFILLGDFVFFLLSFFASLDTVLTSSLILLSGVSNKHQHLSVATKVSQLKTCESISCDYNRNQPNQNEHCQVVREILSAFCFFLSVAEVAGIIVVELYQCISCSTGCLSLFNRYPWIHCLKTLSVVADICLEDLFNNIQTVFLLYWQCTPLSSSSSDRLFYNQYSQQQLHNYGLGGVVINQGRWLLSADHFFLWLGYTAASGGSLGQRMRRSRSPRKNISFRTVVFRHLIYDSSVADLCEVGEILEQ